MRMRSLVILHHDNNVLLLTQSILCTIWTARHMVKDIWLKNNELNILSKHDLLKIHWGACRQVWLRSPGFDNGGHICSHKIAVNFSSFKADQWKNWTLIFFFLCSFWFDIRSTYWILEEVCSGMSLLHASIISREQIEEAHELLL